MRTIKESQNEDPDSNYKNEDKTSMTKIMDSNLIGRQVIKHNTL